MRPTQSFCSPRAYGGTLVRVEDQAGPMLRQLARDFPNEYRRALGRVGYHLQQEARTAMQTGGTSIGEEWPDRSLLAQYKPFQRLRKDMWRTGKRQGLARGRQARGGGSLELALTKNSPLLAGSPNRKPRNFGAGRLSGALRYRVERNAGRVRIGFLTTSAARYAAALMSGELVGGASGTNRPVTEKMRRMFWAAGVPLAKDTKTLTQEPRPLIRPLFRNEMQKSLRMMELSIRAYLRGMEGKHVTGWVATRL